MTTHGTWAALLAGGDGRRLQPLTRSLTGDHRPKQFCCLLGNASLLAETRQRVNRLVRPERTLFVVSKQHEPFYRDELRNVAAALMARAGLWNTLVTVAGIAALEALVAAASPGMWSQLQVLGARRGVAVDPAQIAAVYAGLTAADFSRDALTACPERLRVMALPDVGWTDLGHPDRVADVLADRRHVLANHGQIAG